MTPEQQRIAIAEACGWKFRVGPNASGWRNPAGQIDMLPDYLNDLNAMHEAEESIKDWPKWIKMLAKVIAGVPEAARAGGTKVFVDSSILARAKARARAEAFLRTLNLWKD